MEYKNIFDLDGLRQKGAGFAQFFGRFAVFRIFAGRGKLILFIFLLLLFVSEYFLVYVQPNEFGIKVVRIGLQKGVHKEVYPPGYQFVIPGFQEMITIPRDIQVLELTNSPGTASNEARTERAAHIQTSDGFYVSVDVSIIYKIADPYLVVTTIGPGRLFEDNGIIPKTEPALKATLGELTTEEFFNSPLRVKKTEQAKNLLNVELQPKGIKVEQVLVRYFKYSDEIQRNIEQKKLKDQLVFKNQAEGRAAKEEAILKKIIQEGKATITVEMEGGSAYVTKRNAERDRYVRTKNAEADLLVKLAEAEKVRLKNEALQGMGSERMVGLKMADVYKGLDVVILPSDGAAGINPLDLNKTLQLFEVRQGGGK